MNVHTFSQQVESLHGRLAQLYRDANDSVQLEANLLLPVALKELGTASEVLEVAAEKLVQQTEELAATRSQIEMERQRYQSLFEFMPNAYLVTDAQGKIQEANRAAAELFSIEQSFLVNKLLVSFLPLRERQVFRAKLAQLQQCDRSQEYTVCVQPRKGEFFDAALSVTPVRDAQGNLTRLCWIVRDITERKRAQLALLSHEYDPSQDRPREYYSKGEFISLEPQKILLVCQGIVKLSTMSESGDEILVGLAGPSMPFGSTMTSLSIYQATVLTQDVQLVSISLGEIAASPRLTQALLPQISDRVRQTESLLAIAGKRQVKDRLYYLLLWLKQEFGQRVAQGTRLSVRLTHQDLADACCTTRVTVTRELSKLHKQGKITFDSQHHIVFSSTPSQQAA
jgi:PAS domain S-box-containing protein